MDDAVTRIFNAIARGDREAVARMLADDATLGRAQNHARVPVLVFARYTGDRDVLKTLIGAGPPLDVFDAAKLDDTDRLSELLDADATAAGAYASDGFTALHFAAFYGAPGAVRLLLDRGASVGARTTNFLANMPLHAAAASSWPAIHDICPMLIEAGADVNDAQQGGNRPIHTAGFKGDRRLAAMLIDAGADVGARNEEGKTAAEMAELQGFGELGALLRGLEAG